MKKRSAKRIPTARTGGEIGRIRIIEDFLPPPDKLVLRKRSRDLRRGIIPGKSQPG